MSYGAKIENHSESVSTSATATMENRSKTIAIDIGHPFLLFPRPIFTRPIFSQNIVKTKESHCISHCNRWIFLEILLLPVPALLHLLHVPALLHLLHVPALSQKALFRKTQEKIGPMMENGEADCKIVFQPPKIFLIIYRRLSTQLSTNKRLSGKKMEPNMFPKLFASDGLRNLVCLSIEYLASRLRG